MYRVHVVGWKEDRDVLPISFAKVVREHCGMGLGESKALLDDFAEQGEVVVKFDDKDKATAFAAAATSLGARCDVQDGDQ